MPFANPDNVLLTTTYRKDRGQLSSKLYYLKHSNRNGGFKWDLEVFHRAWERVHDDYSIMLLVDQQGRDSATAIGRHSNTTGWDVLTRRAAISKAIDQISRDLGDNNIPREVMERLLLYTHYVRGPISPKLARQVNNTETDREQNQATQTWPCVGWGSIPTLLAGNSVALRAH